MIEFTVPLPPRALNPQGTGVQQRWQFSYAKAYRETIMIEGRNALADDQWRWRCVDDGSVLYRVSLFAGRGVCGHAGGDRLLPDKKRCYRPLDVTNLVSAFKHGFDGLKDAGIIPDDNYRVMELGEVRIVDDAPGVVRVRIEAHDAAGMPA